MIQKSNYKNTYQDIPQPGNPRQTEAWALTQAARRLKEAQESDPFDRAAFVAAVRLNWRLWTIFQAEISAVDCPLPVEIRQNVLSLCNYVDKVSVDIISDASPEKADSLVNINRELAAGLFARPEQAPDEPVGGGPAIDGTA